jgi:hypothetical protein
MSQHEEQEEESGPESESGTSWLSGLAERFAPEIDKFKGLAIGASLGVVRDMITAGETGDLGTRLSEVIDQVTEKLGGTPIGSSQRKEHTEEWKPEHKEKAAGVGQPSSREGQRLEGIGSRKGEQSQPRDRR